MKKLFKILLTFFAFCLFTFAFIMPLNPVGNWYQQFLPNLNNQPISDVFFIDSLTGWATTGDGLPNDSNYLLKTTTGGDSWQIKFTAYRDFFKVRFINQNTGFVCGGLNSIGQVLYKSTNGGENWYPINAPSVIRILDMSVLNEDTLWLAESDAVEGGVYRTTNGGTNWELQYQGLNPNRIYFYNRSFGLFSYSTGNALFRTTNSGDNWVQVTGENGFRDITFVDTLTGWKANGTIKKTTNGGLNWVAQTMPSGGIILSNAVNRISVINRDTIFGVGGEVFYGAGQFRGMIYRTVNGGANWQFQVPDTAIHFDTYTQIQFINAFTGWAYRLEGGIHTTVGGDTEWITPVTQISTEVPKVYMLYQNYPNPFNPNTNIKYQISNNNSNVIISVYHITGKHVLDLVNQKQTTGIYEVDFDGSNLSSGVYFYTLISGNNRETKKMLLLK